MKRGGYITMKKVICFLVFVITAFLIVFCFMNNGLKSTEKLEQGKAFCESIISDLEQGEVTIEEKYTNRGQISRYVEYLKESDSAIINLSSYFDINMNESTALMDIVDNMNKSIKSNIAIGFKDSVRISYTN